MTTTAYHHGDLRSALLREAEEQIRADGPATVSLRGLARATGVSHAAPAHHFGTKRGLLTALATQGHELLAVAMQKARAEGTFADVGIAYVRFAVDHPAHFAVMFRPELLDLDDPALHAARESTLAVLGGGSRAVADSGKASDAASAAVAAWSLVHGLATLHLTGNLAGPDVRRLTAGGDVLDLARRATSALFRPEGEPS